MPVRMTPLEPPAADAIVVGDSRRAFALAQALTIQPRMSHQARGLWGYTGTSPGGLDLTVQSTGVGGPSAVAVISDLAASGVSTVVRLGTCISLSERLGPGDRLLVERAIAADGAGRTLAGRSVQSGSGPGPVVIEPDRDLFGSLCGLARPATISSHDLVARLDPGTGPAGGDEWSPVARDLQTAATLAVAAKLNLRGAAILVVAEDGRSERVPEAELEELFLDLAPAVLGALERS